ncbi:hypothetical protein [Streptomyces phaeochromogenes]|uniref:hypothetical protein n=1 Tax=Streptomyces phaeochromogenes TaxID=1923 RepID=UPI00386E2109|nr:hypothetical protein OG277_53645 [Streptomyces phaeochromogenes]
MARTFDELVEMQRAADETHGRVRELGDNYGRSTATPWTPQWTEVYKTVWQHWRDLATEIQAAVPEHAKEQHKPHFGVEAAVRTKARHPEPAAA